METVIEVELQPSYINGNYLYIGIGKKWWHLFPSITSDVEIEAEPIGIILSQFYVETGKYHHHGFSKNLGPWREANNLQPRDRIRITPINDKKRYKFKILKSYNSLHRS
jgi:hypothetical protein